MKNLKVFIVALVAVLGFNSCDSNDDEMNHHIDADHVSAVIKFDHSLAIGDDIVIKDVENGVDQTLILGKFKFLISDVKVVTSEDEVISVPNNLGGNLIDLAHATNKEVKVYLSGLPKGEYKSVSFGIGVSEEVAGGSATDQTKLFELAQADMNWTWNPNSYIFSKIEATNKSVEAAAKDLSIHIGKKANFNGFRTVSLDFPQNFEVNANVSPSVHVKIAIEKLFTPDTGTSVYLDAPSKADYADNYTNIFEVHHVHPLDDAISLDDVDMTDHSGDGSSHNH